jgi:hypothetical protein
MYKFLSPGAIYTLDQVCGATDKPMVYKEDSNRNRLLCVQAHGFNFWRTDFRMIIVPPEYTPTMAVVMCTVPAGGPCRVFHFLKDTKQ